VKLDSDNDNGKYLIAIYVVESKRTNFILTARKNRTVEHTKEWENAP
jgi:hypothetical protein